MQQIGKWLGGFYGGNLGFLNYEILTFKHFKKADLSEEAALMRSKWFDYRRLHPLQATYYFLQCYNKAYRDFYRKAFDAERADFVRATKELDFLATREKTSFWRLRQFCDRHGMRYDFFIGFAMAHHYKCLGRDGKMYIPRPNHIIGNEELLADAIIAWEETCKASLQVALSPYYRVSNFVGAQDQLDYEAFMVQQIKLRKVPRFALHAALYLYDAVRFEEALRSFPHQTIVGALVEAESVSHN